MERGNQTRKDKRTILTPVLRASSERQNQLLIINCQSIISLSFRGAAVGPRRGNQPQEACFSRSSRRRLRRLLRMTAKLLIVNCYLFISLSFRASAASVGIECSYDTRMKSEPTPDPHVGPAALLRMTDAVSFRAAAHTPLCHSEDHPQDATRESAAFPSEGLLTARPHGPAFHCSRAAGAVPEMRNSPKLRTFAASIRRKR